MLGAARTAWDSRVWGNTPPAVNPRRTTAAATNSTYTFTGLNGANYTTSLYEFAPGSLNASGSTQYIQASGYSGAWPSGTGDFCIEGWVYLPTGRTAGTADVVCNNQSQGLCIRFGTGYLTGGVNHISIFARGSADLDYCNYTWTTNAWTHWAVQRKSGVISFWAGGSKQAIAGGTSASTYNFAAPSSANITMADYDSGGGGEPLKGYLDEVCVSNSWRYDDAYSTYTIPTAAFTVDTITNMLIHFNSSLTTAAT